MGAYGLLLKTTDGGRTWQSWFDRQDNPRLMNLYAIRPAAGGLYIAGEGGTVLKLDPATQRFVATPIDYTGSMFGVADAGDAVLVFGLRGNAFRSADGGATWTKIEHAAAGDDRRRRDPARPGRWCWPTRAGASRISNDGGVTFELIPLQRNLPLTSITMPAPGGLRSPGPFGAMVVAPDSTR